MSESNEAKVRKRRGPKPRYRAQRQDIHIVLTTDLLRRIDEVAEEGRPEYIERIMREHFKMPAVDKQEG